MALVMIALPLGANGVALPEVSSAAADVVAQPRLVADINPTENTEYGSTGWLTAVGEAVCFSGDDGFHGLELWCSDGTEAGTQMVRDVQPGSGSSEVFPGPISMTDVDGDLFFIESDDVHGRELWRSDGTEAGTQMVEDIQPDNSPDPFGVNQPESLTNVDGTLFFTANDGEQGRELWSSDGTAAGTQMVKDIYPGETESYPGELTNVDGTLFFTANDGEHGGELWRSDGTAAGTQMVRDIYPGETSRYPGPANSNPDQFTKVGGALFFVANDEPLHGGEVWRSDGTEAGTEIVRDIAPGPTSAGPAQFTKVGGTLFFTADDPLYGGEELWRSDGTEAGTKMVIAPGWGDSTMGQLTDIGGTLFFAVESGYGSGLWRSDGTEAGTEMVKAMDVPTYGADFTNVRGTLFFVARDAVYGYELWRSDGTEAGTEMVGEVYPGADSYPFPAYLTAVGKTLFFVASDGIHGYDALWALDTPDDAPSAIGDEATLMEDAPATAVDVLANDIDSDAGPKAIDSTTQPAHGTVEMTGEGAGLTYKPDLDYCNDPPGDETDDFEYTLAPGGSSARVAVAVICADDSPATPPLEQSRTGVAHGKTGISPSLPPAGVSLDAGGSSPGEPGRATPMLLDRRVRVMRRWAAVTLRCAGRVGCRGRLWIFPQRSGAQTSEPGFAVVKGTYTIPGERARVVWLKLTAAGRRMGQYRHVLGGRLVIVGAHQQGRRLIAVRLHFAHLHR